MDRHIKCAVIAPGLHSNTICIVLLTVTVTLVFDKWLGCEQEESKHPQRALSRNLTNPLVFCHVPPALKRSKHLINDLTV